MKKKAIVVFIAILLFVGIAVVPAYAEEKILASRSGNISEQESVTDLVQRLMQEVIEEGKKYPCVLKALEEGRRVNVIARVGIGNGKVTIALVTEDDCD